MSPWTIALIVFVCLAALAVGLYILLTIIIRKSTLTTHLDLADYKLDVVKDPPVEMIPAKVDKSIVVMMVLKNVAHVLPLTFVRLEMLSEKFENFYVCMYEDNSKDATPQLVSNWCNGHEHRFFRSEKFEIDKKSNRIEKIAMARQKCLELWRAQNIEVDVVMVADADLNGWMNVDGFLTNFSCFDEWDMVWPRGYNSNDLLGKRYYYRMFGIHDRMYDGLAYVEKEDDKPMLWGQSTTKNKKKLDGPEEGEEFLYEVYSAFNGIGLYKGDLLKSFTYKTPENNRVCEHVINHKAIHGNEKKKSFINRYWCVLR